MQTSPLDNVAFPNATSSIEVTCFCDNSLYLEYNSSGLLSINSLPANSVEQLLQSKQNKLMVKKSLVPLKFLKN